jgi:hypothetical protein
MAVGRGVVINGLAIENEVADLADYYRGNVQSGPGSFVMAVKTYEDFGEAMRRKLLREIEYRPRITRLLPLSGGGQQAPPDGLSTRFRPSD